MDSTDPQNRSEWRGCLRMRLVKQVQPSDEDKGLLNGYDYDNDDDDDDLRRRGIVLSV